ncbi:MAG: response regulator transcription factor [Sphingobacteriales bacterium]|nr:MAG: response regulator transcription factor [Sphingobacteriales bacterium]
MEKRVCIVEDDNDLREALGLMIQYTSQYKLCGSFENAETMLREFPDVFPDAVLMDINLPGESGIECVRQLKQLEPELLVLMCTSHDDNEKIFDSLKAGAEGYILKTEGPASIIASLDELFDGGSPMSSSIARKVVASFSKMDSRGAESQGLTSREKEILELLATGQMNKEVAYQLNISNGTVRKHIQNIYKKLHVNTRVEAVNVYWKR